MTMKFIIAVVKKTFWKLSSIENKNTFLKVIILSADFKRHMHSS